MGCCSRSSNSDTEALLGSAKPSPSLCFRCIMYNCMIFVPVSAIVLSLLYFLRDSPCYMRFEFLSDYEANYGDLVSRFYLDRCEEARVILLPHAEEKLLLPNPPIPSKDQCSNFDVASKFDCFPRGNMTEKDCMDRGCCYINSNDPSVPSCFYPKQFHSYVYSNITLRANGVSALMKAAFRSPYPGDFENLKFEADLITPTQMRVHIFDPSKLPHSRIYPKFTPPKEPIESPLLRIEINDASSGFKIIRNATNRTLFNTEDVGGLILSDQLIQISAVLGANHVYGIGERRGSVKVDFDWNTITLFNHDSEPKDQVNGYGYMPMYLAIEDDGKSHSVAYLSTYAMDVFTQPKPAITFRAIGGDVDLLFTVEEHPVKVIASQTKTLAGKPLMPPYWALGFHLSRFGHKTLDDMKKVWARTQAAQIPFDTQWADIDYMKNRNDFTVDPDRYKDLKEFINHLHSVGMKFIPIIDPGISASEDSGTYPPFDFGLTQEIFILNDSLPYMGKVWNKGSTVFVDFSHPRSIQYWTKMLKNFQKILPFDGVWLDMNEPSNFNKGTECPKNNLNNPPYVPNVDGNLLSYKTVCMSAQHFDQHHYDLHNFYGTLQEVATSLAVVEATGGKRPFVISRSTSLISPPFTGHWTGDVFSTWADLSQSVRDLLSMSIFGQAMVGADICGFNGNTTAALCAKWFQVGAFYPFSRNHNSDDCIDQDPVALGEDVVTSANASLRMRYALLPYLYTLFWDHHTLGNPVIRPLFVEFPKDNNTYGIENQFMWGSALLFAPVLEKTMLYSKVYLAKGSWYNWYDKEVTVSTGKEYISVSPKGKIPVFMREGNIIPLQHPNVTTALSRQNPFMLRVILDGKGTASGMLYWDDGESLKMNYEYNIIDFSASQRTLSGIPRTVKFNTKMLLSTVHIVPVEKAVTNVTLNGTVTLPVSYNLKIKELAINNITVDLLQPFNITWSL